MASLQAGLEQAGELKFGQVGIANLRIRSLDVDRLCAEMRERVAAAPKLFARAAIILDFGALSAPPDAPTTNTLIDALKAAGVLPVAIAYGTSAIESLAAEVGLPLLAKFRASYERSEPVPAVGTLTSATESVPAAPEVALMSAPAAHKPAPTAESGLIQVQPVRSGQQVYAQHRDLTVCAGVGAGAEVIADGSIHIYGALRGRALAGAAGQANARIFCREFHAELVAVAGVYKVLEEVPKELHGKPVQIWLESDRLRFGELA